MNVSLAVSGNHAGSTKNVQLAITNTIKNVAAEWSLLTTMKLAVRKYHGATMNPTAPTIKKYATTDTASWFQDATTKEYATTLINAKMG